MDLRGAILGLLDWKPASGYDLKRIISESEIFYWSGNNNQIYKSLIELEKEGMVTHQVLLQESLPAKKIYSITEKGRSELRQSLLAVPEAPETRKAILVHLAWAEMLPDEQLLALIDAYENELAARLRMLQEQARRTGAHPDRSRRASATCGSASPATWWKPARPSSIGCARHSRR